MSQAGALSGSGSGGLTNVQKIAVQTGTSPVVADASNTITFNGAVVAAGTHPIRTDGTGANTMALEVQTSQAIASTNASNIGLSAFNSAQFTVDANGFVSLVGGGAAVESIGVDAATPPGTNPVVPTAGGLITVTGGQVAAGTTTNVIRTDSLAANTYTVQVQRSSAQAVSTIGANGVAHFDSSVFTVDANGFVSGSGTGFIKTITGNSGGAESPSAGNFNILGTGSITIAGSANTETVQLTGLTNHSLLVGAGTATITNLGVATNGQLPIGSTGADPVLATLTAGTGISITNGAGSISIATNGSSTLNTLTGNTGGAISPTAGNINTLGTGSITIAGSGSTLTTQLTGLTNHNVLVGAGTATITNVAPSATSGVPLISQGAAADPAFGTAVVAGGGTGATSFTAHSLILGQGTSPLTALGAATNGQLPIGSTGADPVLATLTAGTGISITNGAGTISIATNGSSTINTLTGNSGGAISPTAGNINTLGTGSITIAGSGSTLTTQLTGLTNHNVQIGAGTATLTQVAPSATSGVPLISQGSSADPTFGTAVVAGGGTGVTTLTGLALGSGTSAFTGVTYTAKSTFTPGIAFGGGSTGITYSAQTGLYQQVGNMVLFSIVIILSNKGSSTGVATVTGLPVTNGGTAINIPIVFVSVTLDATNLGAYVQVSAGATTMNIYEYSITGGQTQLSNTNFGNSSQIYVNGVYFT